MIYVKFFSKFGIDATKVSSKFYDDVARSYTNQAWRISILDDLWAYRTESAGMVRQHAAASES